MTYTGYQLIWLFFSYSFLGWCLETAGAAMKQKRFVNRGLVNGPLCVIYGICALGIALSGRELTGVWLFAGAAVFTTAVEWMAGHLIERLYHERWWDYSGIWWNLDGYVCLPMSLVWGCLGYISMKWGNHFLIRLFDQIPAVWARAGIWILLGALILDAGASLAILSGKSPRAEHWRQVDAWFDRISLRIEGRFQRAYAARGGEKEEERCEFHQLILLFVAGAFLGDLTETLFCRVTAGVWMSRSSVVYGPFSIVWGLAIALVTASLYRYRDRGDSFLFCAGTVLGGVYEYLCSVFTELAFGTVFWDYSKIPFNLGGRINLLYCFFWGIAAVVWFKLLYPRLWGWICRIPLKTRKLLASFLLLFMAADMAVSAAALTRAAQRREQVPAVESWQRVMDEHFDDERLNRIYPNAIQVP